MCCAKKLTVGCIWYCIVSIVYLVPWLVTLPSIFLTIRPCPLKRTKSIENVPAKYILTLLDKNCDKNLKPFSSNLWTKSILDTRPIAFNYWGRMIYGKKSLISFLGLTYIVLLIYNWMRYICIVWAYSGKVTWEGVVQTNDKVNWENSLHPTGHPHHPPPPDPKK